MALSNSFDFTITRSQIIKKALQIIGVLPEGQLPTQVQKDDASVLLNLLVKSYLSEGLLSWKRKTFVLFPEQGKVKYQLNQSFGNRWTTEDDLVSSDLSVAGAVNDTTIELSAAATSPFISGTPAIDTTYNVGVKLDSGVFHWTTVASVTSQTNLDLTDALPSSAAIGNKVYLHNLVASVPHNILNVSRRNASDTDVQLNLLAMRDYHWLTKKTQQGTPNSYSYQGDSSVTELYVWPAPSTEERFYILAQEGFDDMDDEGSTLAMSNEVYLAFVWEFAANISYEYGVDIKVTGMITGQANKYKERALSYAIENSYIKFEPDARYGG